MGVTMYRNINIHCIAIQNKITLYPDKKKVIHTGISDTLSLIQFFFPSIGDL
jgi:hypothetical protein